MFSKNKKTGIDAVNPGGQNNQRNAFRYCFKKDCQPSLVFKKKIVALINISAQGLAFSDCGFSIDDHDQIQLDIPITGQEQNLRISAGLRILDITEQGVCRSLFTDMDNDQEELIHKYVLEMQKHDLRSRPSK